MHEKAVFYFYTVYNFPFFKNTYLYLVPHLKKWEGGKNYMFFFLKIVFIDF